MVFARGSERMARNVEAFFSEKRREQPRGGVRIERNIESFFGRERKQAMQMHSFYPLMP